MGKRKSTDASPSEDKKRRVSKKMESENSEEELFVIASDESSEDELVISDLVKDSLSEEEEIEEEVKSKKSKSGTPSSRSKKSKQSSVSPLAAEWELDEGLLGTDLKKQLTMSEPPEDLSEAITMLNYQRESLSWMADQESNERWRGGILADDMGMGKTLQAIALLLKTRGKKTLDVSDSTVNTTTLVVAPVVALNQWQNEIAKYTKEGSLKVLVYHGSDRTKDPDVLTSYDVVLTSYSIIETDYRFEKVGYVQKKERKFKPSILHEIHWNRVILDEAHSIKDRSCSTAKSAFALNADARWSLTGTPLQNRIGELFSLVRFLRITPWSYYYCKKCPCKSLHWKFKKGEGCVDCHHSGMSHFSWWNKYVLNP